MTADYKRDDISHPAFEIVSDRFLSEVGGHVTRLNHLATGADVVCVCNQDPNKVMAITFPTLPTDSTGTAHVLEHLIFRGSKRYAVAQPFSTLLRGSMHTHLNATTQADRTSFFVASMNTADFTNLIDVCLDAVLHPLLTQTAFSDEAWHITMKDPEGPLAFGGVVFNEMHGHAAIPGSVLAEETRRALFPDTVYQHVFGGVPADIPRLTIGAVRAFHKQFYHPRNAIVFLWGDDDFGERLAQIDRHFVGTDNTHVPVQAVREQPAFDRPRVMLRHFAGSGASVTNRGWALSQSFDAEIRLERWIMARILMGRSSFSLTKLIRSIGADPVFSIFSQDELQPIMTFGHSVLAATPPDAIVGAIQTHLEQIETNGIDQEIISQAIGELEFELTENDSTPIPQGLAMFRLCIGAWRHGGDPTEELGWRGTMARLRENYQHDPMALSRRIAADLLHNPHRVDVTLMPDPQLVEARERSQAALLACYALRMAPTERQALLHSNRKSDPAVPDSANAVMPRLTRADLSAGVVPDQISQCSLGIAQGLAVTVPDNGIVYLDIGLDIERLSEELFVLVPLYERLLLERVQANPSLAARIGQETGGIMAQHWSAGGGQPDLGAARLFLRGKARAADLPKLGRLMAEVLTGAAHFDDGTVGQIIQSEIARHSERLLAAGHLITDLHLRAGLHRAGALSERLGGIGQLAALRELGRCPPGTIAADLSILHRLLLTSADPVIALGSANPDAITLLADLPDQIGLTGKKDEVHRAAHQSQACAVGYPVESIVNTVGIAGNLTSVGHARTGATAAMAKALQTGLLWDSVRVAGGAYGTLCRHDPHTGAISFIAVRDPHILRTLDVFRSAPNWLRHHADVNMIEQCIVGAVGEATRPVLAGQATLSCVQRHLQGITHTGRQVERDELLSTCRADALLLAEALEKAIQDESLVVLGPVRALSEALRERPGLFTVQPAP